MIGDSESLDVLTSYIHDFFHQALALARANLGVNTSLICWKLMVRVNIRSCTEGTLPLLSASMPAAPLDENPCIYQNHLQQAVETS